MPTPAVITKSPSDNPSKTSRPSALKSPMVTFFRRTVPKPVSSAKGSTVYTNLPFLSSTTACDGTINLSFPLPVPKRNSTSAAIPGRIAGSGCPNRTVTGYVAAPPAVEIPTSVTSACKVFPGTAVKLTLTELPSLICEINTSGIYNLEAVSYTSLDDNKRYFGLIAEDVAEIIPELAEFAIEKDVIPGSNSDKLIPDAVRYSMLSVLLLNEVQKHEETIKSQSDKIKNLEEKNTELEERLKKLEELISK